MPSGQVELFDEWIGNAAGSQIGTHFPFRGNEQSAVVGQQNVFGVKAKLSKKVAVDILERGDVGEGDTVSAELCGVAGERVEPSGGKLRAIV